MDCSQRILIKIAKEKRWTRKNVVKASIKRIREKNTRRNNWIILDDFMKDWLEMVSKQAKKNGSKCNQLPLFSALWKFNRFQRSSSHVFVNTTSKQNNIKRYKVKPHIGQKYRLKLCIQHWIGWPCLCYADKDEAFTYRERCLLLNWCSLSFSVWPNENRLQPIQFHAAGFAASQADQSNDTHKHFPIKR